MTGSPAPVAWYGAHAPVPADAHEALDPARVHGWPDGLLPPTPALVLDVGAGSGRDAAWLARLGHDVVAVGSGRSQGRPGAVDARLRAIEAGSPARTDPADGSTTPRLAACRHSPECATAVTTDACLMAAATSPTGEHRLASASAANRRRRS